LFFLHFEALLNATVITKQVAGRIPAILTVVAAYALISSIVNIL